jgi:diguanylate cyclase (GGDEF)-like protein/PAS domain S-box-containing protein
MTRPPKASGGLKVTTIGDSLPTSDDRQTPASPDDAWSSQLLARLPALVTCIDRSLHFRYLNDMHREWAGIDPAAVVGHPVEAWLDPATYRAILPCLQRALDGATCSYEGAMFSGPARRYMHGSFQPDLDADGRVRGVITVFSDVTDRHTLEQRLRESEQRFFGAFQHAAIGMALVSPEGRFLRVNAAVCQMLQYTEEEFLALDIAAVTHPDDMEADDRQLAELLAGRRDSYQMEKRNFRKDGQVVHLQLSVSVVRDAEGQPLYFVSQAQDISARKRFEDALFRERELAEVTLNSIGDAVLTTDLELRVTSLNPIAEAMTGWPRAQALEQSLDEVFQLQAGTDGATAVHPLRQAIARNTIVDVDGRIVLRHRNGFVTPVEGSAAPIHDHAGNVIGGVLVFHDVTESRSLALRMMHLTQHDALTGLPNRQLLHTRIAQAVSNAARRRQRGAVLHLDVDHFKRINETWGHDAGDRVLRALAQRLRAALGSDDVLSRLSGDEFVALLPQIEAPGDAAAMAECLLDACSQVRPEGLSALELRACIGISLFPDDGSDPEQLLRNADSAMYETKANGRHGYRFYTPSMRERDSARRRIEDGLHNALARQQLRLLYQPKVDARHGGIVGTEALLRWSKDEGGWWLPDEFVPVAEDSGLIVPIGAWVLREACRQAAAWKQAGHGIPISVNVSPLQLEDAGFLALLDTVLTETGLDPRLLELELTERIVVSGGRATGTLLRAIRQLGVRISLDDFGTGYCSLSYLRQFPVDTLKIDRAFVHDIPQDAETTAITTGIIAMARSLNKDVVAEGVETIAQADFLRDAGCSSLQGFLYGRPMEAELLGARLRERA